MPYGTMTLGALSHTPQRLLASTWLGYLGLYFLGPVHYHRSLALVTVVFVLACNGGFILGAAGVARHHGRPRAADGRFLPALDRSIRLFAVVGILGAGLVVADKLLGGRVDFSEGLGVMRLQLQGTLEDEPFRPRSVVLWVGTLVYSFSNAALVLYILHGRVSRRTAAWVVVSSFSPAAVILMYGGRSSAFVTLLLVFSAGLVRLACGQPLLPRAHYLRALLAIHLALLSGGSLYVFASRGAALGVGGGGALKRLVVNLDATLSSSVEQRIEEEGAAGALTANSLMFFVYLTHPLSELDYLVTENTRAGPFLGVYEGSLLVRAVQVLMGLPDRLFQELDEALDRPGFFFTAWGGMYLDFGLWLSPLVAAGLGAITGTLYRRGVGQGSLAAKMLLVFMYVYVLTSPIHSAFTIGNAMQTLMCLIGAAFLVQGLAGGTPEPARPAGG